MLCICTHIVALGFQSNCSIYKSRSFCGNRIQLNFLGQTAASRCEGSRSWLPEKISLNCSISHVMTVLPLLHKSEICWKKTFSITLFHIWHITLYTAALAYTKVMSTKHNYDGHGKRKLMTLLRQVPWTEENYYHSFLTNTRHKMTNSKHSCSLYKHLSTHHALTLTSKVPVI